MTSTMSRTRVAGLAVAAVVLAGCGSGGTADPADSSAPSVPAAASTAAPAPSGSAGGASDPCRVLSAGQVTELTGVEVLDGTSQAVGASTVCTWSPKDGTKAGSAVFSAQTGALPGPLDQVAEQLRTQFAGTVDRLSVPGADDARYLTGTSTGLEVIDVVAAKDDVFCQVLVASPRDPARHKAAAVTIASTLLGG